MWFLRISDIGESCCFFVCIFFVVVVVVVGKGLNVLSAISIKDFLGFCMNDFFWKVVQGCFLESPPKKQPSKVGPYHPEFVSYQKVCFDMLSLKTRKINLFMCKYRVYSIRIKSPGAMHSFSIRPI